LRLILKVGLPDELDLLLSPLLKTQQPVRSLHHIVLFIQDRIISDFLVITELLDRRELLLIVSLDECRALSQLWNAVRLLLKLTARDFVICRVQCEVRAGIRTFNCVLKLLCLCLILGFVWIKLLGFDDLLFLVQKFINILKVILEFYCLFDLYVEVNI